MLGGRRRLLPHRPPARPQLSVVVVARDRLVATQTLVESVRRNTDVPYELIMVDDGSRWPDASYLREAADRPIRNERPLGFQQALRQAADASGGPFVALCSVDTVLPPGWASVLFGDLADRAVGAVLPRLDSPKVDEGITILDPLAEPPPIGLLVAPRRAFARRLAARTLAGAYLDVVLDAWARGLPVLHDGRVVVRHLLRRPETQLFIRWRALAPQDRRALRSRYAALRSAEWSPSSWTESVAGLVALPWTRRESRLARAAIRLTQSAPSSIERKMIERFGARRRAE